MANLPSETRELEFFVRLLEGGQWSGALTAMCGLGVPVSVEGLGSFTLRDCGRRSVFVAGGTGLAPVLAILRRLAADSARQPCHTRVRSEADLFGQEGLAWLAAALPALDIHIAVAEPTKDWAGECGTAVELLTRRLSGSADPAAKHYYLCGPPAMVCSARDLLQSLGVPSRGILWRNPRDKVGYNYARPEYWQHMGRTMERGLFDAMFIADELAPLPPTRTTRTPSSNTPCNAQRTSLRQSYPSLPQRPGISA